MNKNAGGLLFQNRRAVKPYGEAHRSAAEADVTLRDDRTWTRFYDPAEGRFVAKNGRRGRYGELMASGELQPPQGYLYNTATERLVKASGRARAGVVLEGNVLRRAEGFVTVEVRLYTKTTDDVQHTTEQSLTSTINGTTHFSGRTFVFNVPKALMPEIVSGEYMRPDDGRWKGLLRALATRKVYNAQIEAAHLKNIMKNLTSDLEYVSIVARGDVPADPSVAMADIPAGLVDVTHITKHVFSCDLLPAVPHVDGDKLVMIRPPRPDIPNRQPDDCVAAAIYEQIAPDWNRKHKKESSQMTIEGILAKTKPEGATSNKRSAKDMCACLKAIRVEFTVLDIYRRVIFHWAPEDDGLSRNKHLNPSHCYFLLHNEHMLPILEDTRGLSNSLVKRGKGGEALPNPLSKEEPKGAEEPNEAEELRASAHYPDMRFKTADFHQITSFEALTQFIVDMTALEGSHRAAYTVHTCMNLEELSTRLRTEFNYEAKHQVLNNEIVGLVLTADKCPRFTIKAIPIELDEPMLGIPAEQYGLFIDGLSSLVNNLFTPDNKSQLSPGMQLGMEHMMMGPINGRFSDRADMVETTQPASRPRKAVSASVDFSRAYTAWLCWIKYFPVFRAIDDFDPYDGHTLEPLSLYKVENTSNTLQSWFIGSSKYSLQYGYVLTEVQRQFGLSFKIISSCRPSARTRNTVGPVIETIYNSGLDERLKKWLVNCVIGLLGKRTSRKQKCHWSTCIKEAWAYAVNGKAPMLAMGGYLTVIDGQETQLIDGYTPIYHLILSIQRLRMLEAAMDLQARGARSMGVRTDAIFVDKIPDGFPLVSTKRFEDIGKMHAEQPKRLPMTYWGVFRNADHVPTRTVQDPTPTPTLVPGTLVQALLPGAGKTTLLANELPKGETLFLCTTNEQAEGIRAREHESATVSRFLGERVADDGELTEGGGLNVDAYSHIVLNELYANSMKSIGKLVARLKDSGKNIYADGDSMQITPPNDTTNPHAQRHRKRAIERAVQCILPHRIVLEGSHRLIHKSEVPILMMMHAALTAGESIRDIVERFCLRICTTFEEAVAVGRGIAKTNLICNIMSDAMGRLKPSTERVAKKHDRRLVQNRRYVILGEDETDYVVECNDGVMRWMKKSLFRRSEVVTVDSYQGSTIDDPYVIFEADGMTIDRLWVALSRCRELRQLHFYFGPLPTDNCRELVKGKIVAYTRTDEAAGRVCDLTVDWVLERAKQQNYRCAVDTCQKELQMMWEGGDSEQLSVDRIDNGRGHTQSNCRLTCLRCNLAGGSAAKTRARRVKK